MNPLVYPDNKLNRLQSIALIMAVVGLVLFVIGFITSPGSVWQSYLYAYLFWLGVTAGSIGLLLLHHMVSGGWGFLIRGQLEAASRLLPWMAVLFVPLAIFGLFNIAGMNALYPWTDPEVAHHGVVQKKLGYLNIPFFLIRAALYFIIWGVIAMLLNRWGRTQYDRSDPEVTNRLNHLGSFGMVLMVITMTFAMVDWVMSLEPEWFSSIIGLLFSATHTLSAMATMLALFAYINGDLPELLVVPRRYFRDQGNLLLALVMLWAYLSFSQLLIIYSANIAEEALWYVHRERGGWGFISLSLIPLHFALPFLVLLVGSGLKQNPRRLAGVALFIVVMRHVDLFWWVAPTFRHHLYVTFADFGAPLLIGGIWLYLWVGQLRGRAILPVYDPRLEGHLPAQEVEVVSHV
ncbi:MAG: hypothetical protein KY468_00175 [Armatimonadetes bacterium]|nr:hypothetical protein [Armatimonadota bacterium]